MTKQTTLTATENISGVTIKAYDNGGKTFDRYSVLFMDESTTYAGSTLYARLTMSENPFHPQGVGIADEEEDGAFMGKRIAFADLPENCQKAVMQDVQAILDCRSKQAD